MNTNDPGHNYYFTQPHVTRTPQQPLVDNILFVADLPEETCEEDLCNFFKSYNFTLAKVFQYLIN
jgi:hypothetical protein